MELARERSLSQGEEEATGHHHRSERTLLKNMDKADKGGKAHEGKTGIN